MYTKKEEKESLEVMKYRLMKVIKKSTWKDIRGNVNHEITMALHCRRGRKKDEKEKDSK